MTPDEMRIAIAKDQGWRKHISGKDPNPEDFTYWTQLDQDGSEIKWVREHDLPDYCNDLNAMHEVEAGLSPVELYDYYYNYLQPKFQGSCVNTNACIATARQRAEAYCNYMGHKKEINKVNIKPGNEECINPYYHWDDAL